MAQVFLLIHRDRALTGIAYPHQTLVIIKADAVGCVEFVAVLFQRIILCDDVQGLSIQLIDGGLVRALRAGHKHVTGLVIHC